MTIVWAPQFKQRDFTLLKETTAYSGYSQIKQFQLEYPLFQGGKSHPVVRELIVRPMAVAALLYDPDQDKVVLVEQFRTGAMFEAESPWLLEIVAGLTEPGESVEQAAYREALEETGCRILSLVPITCYFTTPGISNEKIMIYCAKIKAPQVGGNHGVVEEGEDINVHIFKTKEAFRLLAEGKIISSPAIIALQWLQLNQFSLRFPQ